VSTPGQGSSFDTSPLTDPVDPRAVSAFAAELRSRRAPQSVSSIVFTTIFVVLGGALLVWGLDVPGLFLSLLGEGGHIGGIPLFSVVVPILAVLVGVTTWARWRSARIRRWRLGRFAQANGMTYTDSVAAPPLPGMIFGIGTAREASDVVRGTRPRYVEFGDYEYTVKRGKSSTTHRWGYIAVKLSTPLPHIVLDATGNNGFGSNLPVSFRGAQRLSLEGDFDQHFHLYCPEGYEQDALYLFSPDIMARFIDDSAELDVEIIDDWLFLYTRRRVSTLDPATWAWLFGVVTALISQLDQWERWRDDRLLPDRDPSTATERRLPFTAPAGLLRPPRGVAMQGRRLKRRLPWVPLIACGILFASLAWFMLR
jgi:hypothetical protein